MIDSLCGPCQDAGKMVKAHYMTNPPTCRDCYAKRPKVAGGNTALGNLFALRLENKKKLREHADEQQEGVKLCEPCLEGGDRTKATHRMNDMDMCVTHANAARIESGPPQALRPEDVTVREKPAKLSIGDQAKKLMASGLSAEDTISALVNLGFGKRESKAAVGIPEEKPEKEKRMAARIDDATQKEIITDLKSGMNFNQVSLKHSVSWGLVRKISEESGVAPAKASKAAVKVKVDRRPINIPLRTLVSPAVNSLLAKWNDEANAAFAALPLEKKAELLASLEA